MRGEISVFRPVEAYAETGSSRAHGVVAIISFCVFVGTIVFGFVPVTRDRDLRLFDRRSTGGNNSD